MNVSGALDSLPELGATSTEENHLSLVLATGTAGALPPDSGHAGHSESITVTLTRDFENQAVETSGSEASQIPTKKGLSEGNSDKPCESGRQDLNLRPLHPQCSALPS